MTKTAVSFFDRSALSLDELKELCAQQTRLGDYPLAAAVTKNVVIYDGEAVRELAEGENGRFQIKSEWARCLKDGPGVFAIKGAYADLSLIDRSTAVFQAIVAAEKAAGQGRGDHFGNNERIWNSIQKACLHDPDLFIDYYGHPLLALACEAWLGPHYQITAQMNNVKPGGKAQSAHRDYHLGFQSRQTIAQFPAHAQMMSQYLTLQGAIAHCDMPLEKGPTLFLPYSQQYPTGYLAFREPQFAAYFDEARVQIPFGKGDMVFFSPALFHGGGHNSTATDRVANLVQVSSAFGRTMETLNHRVMIEVVYPALQKRAAEGRLNERLLLDTVAALADGYSFPTNLDSDPPIGGNAPETQQQMVLRAVAEGWLPEKLGETLMAYAERRLA